MELLKDISDIQRLPKDIATLKKNSATQLPLLPQCRKKVALILEKLLSLAASAKFDFGNSPPQAWFYWFNPASLISIILSSPLVTNHMYFGMAEFVDRPTEFWHLISWASSIRLTSRNYAYYLDSSLIFPSDFVKYRCKIPGCTCNAENTHKGRV
jgi:hypothetical protein